MNDLLQAVGSCNDRLQGLTQAAGERSDLDKQEDRCSEQLKIWCIRVRSLVLVPSIQENADLSRPLADGSLSPPMLDLFKDAETLGIAKFQDVHQVANAFRCMCWASLAMSTLAKKSTLKEIQHVMTTCSSITLSDEKTIRMLKSMMQRTYQWQVKARKALTPKPGETRPFNIDVLNSLDFGSSALPFEVPETTCLANAIEDKGCRHCLCGGANDGTFMLGCDKCEEWFHGRCVGVNKETGNTLENWLCPRCKGEEISLADFAVGEFEPVDIEDDESAAREYAPCAPTVEKLWPPFKLFGSAESLECLGEACLLIPDTFGRLELFDEDSRPSALDLHVVSDKQAEEIPAPTLPREELDVSRKRETANATTENATPQPPTVVIDDTPNAEVGDLTEAANGTNVNTTSQPAMVIVDDTESANSHTSDKIVVSVEGRSGSSIGGSPIQSVATTNLEDVEELNSTARVPSPELEESREEETGAHWFSDDANRSIDCADHDADVEDNDSAGPQGGGQPLATAMAMEYSTIQDLVTNQAEARHGGVENFEEGAGLAELRVSSIDPSSEP